MVQSASWQSCDVAMAMVNHGPPDGHWEVWSLCQLELVHPVAYLQLQDVNCSFFKRRFQMPRDSKRPKIGLGGAERGFNMSSIQNGWPTRIYKWMFFSCVFNVFHFCARDPILMRSNEYNAYISVLIIKYEPICCAEHPWLLPWF